MIAILTVDLGFGDAGKGTVVDAVARKRKAGLVVRFNGGAQAAHNVVTEDGRHHTFSQFGSATFVPGVKTLLSRFVLVNPLVMQQEELHLQKKGVTDAYERMYVDKRAIVNTPYHRAANRLIEISRDAKRHGSCGLGIGETVEHSIAFPDQVLTIGDLQHKDILWAKLRKIRESMLRRTLGLNLLPHDQLAQQEKGTFEDSVMVDIVRRYEEWVKKVHLLDADGVAKLICNTDVTNFEAAQGVLIDEVYGFHPYTTWSNTTLGNARTILKEVNYPGKVESIGILRAYSVRHGPGPFPTEDEFLTSHLPDKYNIDNVWQRQMRCGWLDLPMLHYALMCNGSVDSLAITHLDYLDRVNDWKIGVNYRLADGRSWGVPKAMVNRVPTLKEQETIGASLMGGFVSVEYEHVPSNLILHRIEQAIGASVSIVSSGPKTNDKMFL